MGVLPPRKFIADERERWTEIVKQSGALSNSEPDLTTAARIQTHFRPGELNRYPSRYQKMTAEPEGVGGQVTESLGRKTLPAALASQDQLVQHIFVEPATVNSERTRAEDVASQAPSWSSRRV